MGFLFLLIAVTAGCGRPALQSSVVPIRRGRRPQRPAESRRRLLVSSAPLHTVTRNLPRYLCGAMWASPPTKFYRHPVCRGGVLPRPSTNAAGTMFRWGVGPPSPPAPLCRAQARLGREFKPSFHPPLCECTTGGQATLTDMTKKFLVAKHTKTVGDSCRFFLQMAGM